ncbi:MAG: malto-oligosyltrehalose trehalohydrolase [Salipiger marinus]|uniref:malto-oligosyltrehalose trehalohydrolase n=1 Tax=Salipiger marinus TaxID=555512 RepID=UPI0040595557
MPQTQTATPAHPRWGAIPTRAGLWHFGIWAPTVSDIALHLDGRTHPMTRVDGWALAECPAAPGMDYGFVLDGTLRPDPATRLQAGDVHGPSRLPDLMTPPPAWSGRPWDEAVIYELHVGSFTRDGTYAAAARDLPRLAKLGITAIELMPLSQFEGNRGWGYDGVLIRAPHPAYGPPEDLRRFIAAAHDLGMMVLLDLVMNHFGPSGNYLHGYCPEFFDEARHTPWGAAIDFHKPQVRRFFLDSAQGWLADYGFDGLRLDAVHQIAGMGGRQFLRELAEQLRGLDRPVHLVTEDERNLPDLREAGYDAEWNDDWHHAIHCALTGEAQGYYEPFAADPLGDLAHAMRHGQIDEGQPRPGSRPPRGAPARHLPPTAFVNSNQTHDQIGNRALGDRLSTLAPPEALPVIHALLLCLPQIPMLFMGEETGSTAPFQFFCDFTGDLARATREGRERELSEIGIPKDDIPDPNDPDILAQCYPFGQDPAREDRFAALTETALRLRRDRIVPLLKSGLVAAPEVTRDGHALSAAWPFDAGTLRIGLRLTPKGATAEAAPFPQPLPEADLTLGDPERDAYALAVRIDT